MEPTYSPPQEVENKIPGDPLISVCIPVYNAKKYIAESVASVVGQGYPDLEVCVQDNMSTDGTWELLVEMAKELPQLSIQRNSTNIGMAPNFNAAINRAKGQYIMAISSDDMLEPGYVQNCMRAFKDTGADVVTTNHYYLKDGLRSKRNIEIKSGLFVHFERYVLMQNPFSINFTLFRRETIDRMRVNGDLFSCDFYTCDLDLWYRMAFAGIRVYYIDEPLATYRYHDSNLSRQTKVMERQALMVLLAHGKDLKKSCGRDYRYAIAKLIWHSAGIAVRCHEIDARMTIKLFAELLF
jgi:glycosyltransferase involved in cell wall biosynthesis